MGSAPGRRRARLRSEALSDASNVPEKSPAALTGAQRRALRGLGHHLKAVVQIGRNGMTDGLVAAAASALERHELIKVSTHADGPLDRKEAPARLAEAVGAHVAQVLGRTALLYRRCTDEPDIELPGDIPEGSEP